MSETGERRSRRDLRSAADGQAGEAAGAPRAPEWLTSAVPTASTGERAVVPGSRRALRQQGATGAVPEAPAPGPSG
ncbi:MAG: hypothetical protein J0I40_02320, partial [Cellulomonas sp.]|nr:hypothetical protein [Cellulomonas sp.]